MSDSEDFSVLDDLSEPDLSEPDLSEPDLSEPGSEDSSDSELVVLRSSALIPSPPMSWRESLSRLPGSSRSNSRRIEQEAIHRSNPFDVLVVDTAFFPSAQPHSTYDPAPGGEGGVREECMVDDVIHDVADLSPTQSEDLSKTASSSEGSSAAMANSILAADDVTTCLPLNSASCVYQLNQLNQLNRVDQVNQVNKVNQVDQVDQVDQVNTPSPPDGSSALSLASSLLAYALNFEVPPPCGFGANALAKDDDEGPSPLDRILATAGSTDTAGNASNLMLMSNSSAMPNADKFYLWHSATQVDVDATAELDNMLGGDADSEDDDVYAAFAVRNLKEDLDVQEEIAVELAEVEDRCPPDCSLLPPPPPNDCPVLPSPPPLAFSFMESSDDRDGCDQLTAEPASPELADSAVAPALDDEAVHPFFGRADLNGSTKPQLPSTQECTATTMSQLPSTQECTATTNSQLPSTQEYTATTKPQLPSTQEYTATTKPQLPSTQECTATTMSQLPSTQEYTATTKPQLPSTQDYTATTKPQLPSAQECTATTKSKSPSPQECTATTKSPLPSPQEYTATTPDDHQKQYKLVMDELCNCTADFKNLLDGSYSVPMLVLPAGLMAPPPGAVPANEPESAVQYVCVMQELSSCTASFRLLLDMIHSVPAPPTPLLQNSPPGLVQRWAGGSPAGQAGAGGVNPAHMAPDLSPLFDAVGGFMVVDDDEQSDPLDDDEPSDPLDKISLLEDEVRELRVSLLSAGAKLIQREAECSRLSAAHESTLHILNQISQCDPSLDAEEAVEKLVKNLSKSPSAASFFDIKEKLSGSCPPASFHDNKEKLSGRRAPSKQADLEAEESDSDENEEDGDEDDDMDLSCFLRHKLKWPFIMSLCLFIPLLIFVLAQPLPPLPNLTSFPPRSAFAYRLLTQAHIVVPKPAMDGMHWGDALQARPHNEASKQQGDRQAVRVNKSIEIGTQSSLSVALAEVVQAEQRTASAEAVQAVQRTASAEAVQAVQRTASAEAVQAVQRTASHEAFQALQRTGAKRVGSVCLSSSIPPVLSIYPNAAFIAEARYTYNYSADEINVSPYGNHASLACKAACWEWIPNSSISNLWANGRSQRGSFGGELKEIATKLGSVLGPSTPCHTLVVNNNNNNSNSNRRSQRASFALELTRMASPASTLYGLKRRNQTTLFHTHPLSQAGTWMPSPASTLHRLKISNQTTLFHTRGKRSSCGIKGVQSTVGAGLFLPSFLPREDPTNVLYERPIAHLNASFFREVLHKSTGVSFWESPSPNQAFPRRQAPVRRIAPAAPLPPATAAHVHPPLSSKEEVREHLRTALHLSDDLLHVVNALHLRIALLTALEGGELEMELSQHASQVDEALTLATYLMHTSADSLQLKLKLDQALTLVATPIKPKLDQAFTLVATPLKPKLDQAPTLVHNIMHNSADSLQPKLKLGVNAPQNLSEDILPVVNALHLRVALLTALEGGELELELSQHASQVDEALTLATYLMHTSADSLQLKLKLDQALTLVATPIKPNLDRSLTLEATPMNLKLDQAPTLVPDLMHNSADSLQPKLKLGVNAPQNLSEDILPVVNALHLRVALLTALAGGELELELSQHASQVDEALTLATYLMHTSADSLQLKLKLDQALTLVATPIKPKLDQALTLVTNLMNPKLDRSLTLVTNRMHSSADSLRPKLQFGATLLGSINRSMCLYQSHMEQQHILRPYQPGWMHAYHLQASKAAPKHASGKELVVSAPAPVIRQPNTIIPMPPCAIPMPPVADPHIPMAPSSISQILHLPPSTRSFIPMTPSSFPMLLPAIVMPPSAIPMPPVVNLHIPMAPSSIPMPPSSISQILPPPPSTRSFIPMTPSSIPMPPSAIVMPPCAIPMPHVVDPHIPMASSSIPMTPSSIPMPPSAIIMPPCAIPMPPSCLPLAIPLGPSLTSKQVTSTYSAIPMPPVVPPLSASPSPLTHAASYSFQHGLPSPAPLIPLYRAAGMSGTPALPLRTGLLACQTHMAGLQALRAPRCLAPGMPDMPVTSYLAAGLTDTPALSSLSLRSIAVAPPHVHRHATPGLPPPSASRVLSTYWGSEALPRPQQAPPMDTSIQGAINDTATTQSNSVSRGVMLLQPAISFTPAIRQPKTIISMPPSSIPMPNTTGGAVVPTMDGSPIALGTYEHTTRRASWIAGFSYNDSVAGLSYNDSVAGLTFQLAWPKVANNASSQQLIRASPDLVAKSGSKNGTKANVSTSVEANVSTGMKANVSIGVKANESISVKACVITSPHLNGSSFFLRRMKPTHHRQYVPLLTTVESSLITQYLLPYGKVCGWYGLKVGTVDGIKFNSSVSMEFSCKLPVSRIAGSVGSDQRSSTTTTRRASWIAGLGYNDSLYRLSYKVSGAAAHSSNKVVVIHHERTSKLAESAAGPGDQSVVVSYVLINGVQGKLTSWRRGWASCLSFNHSAAIAGSIQQQHSRTAVQRSMLMSSTPGRQGWASGISIAHSAAIAGSNQQQLSRTAKLVSSTSSPSHNNSTNAQAASAHLHFCDYISMERWVLKRLASLHSGRDQAVHIVFSATKLVPFNQSTVL
eukprot:gene13503-19362_t